jgi:GT2 family glycosyltransferase
MNVGTVAVGFLDPGHWSHCFGQSLIDMYLVDAHTSQRMVPRGKQLRDHCQAGGVAQGRNSVATKFLDATDCEWLFMVDSDMGFGPDTVERLIASADPQKRPVVGGLCFSLRRDTAGEFYGQKYVVVPTCYEYVDTDDELGFRSIIDYPRDALIQVGGTGGACLLIHRSALERVREKVGDHWFDQITHPRGTTFSEDLSFCIRLAALDIPLFVDTGVRTTHDKHGVFLDEDEFDRCRALHAQPAKEGAPCP